MMRPLGRSVRPRQPLPLSMQSSERGAVHFAANDEILERTLPRSAIFAPEVPTTLSRLASSPTMRSIHEAC